MTGQAMEASDRLSAFRRLLGALLSGSGTKALVEESRAIIDTATPEDLVAAVDGAVEDGIEFGALKPAVSKLINLISVSLTRHRYSPPSGERLFSSMIAENDELRILLGTGKKLVRELNGLAGAPGETTEGGANVKNTLAGLRELLHRFSAVDIHYKKKENVLFPWFESREPRYRCVRLMWEIHDDVRSGLRELDAALTRISGENSPGLRESLASINQILGRLYFDLNANIFREECALFPVMANTLSPADSEALFDEIRDYDFAFEPDKLRELFTDIHANEAAAALLARAADHGLSSSNVLRDSASPRPQAEITFSGRTGSLAPEVLAAMFAAVPIDMTFVDAEDKVGWFTDSPHRIFARSPAIIGRDVRNCHPGASVARVVAILDSFRKGEKNSEAFWLNMHGAFIYIEYFALRSHEGKYLGTLECSQDLTDKRLLEGEKRL